ncbi:MULTISPECIES: glycosyltransferase family 39 protein [unclassified Saccharopolyspora]|uniref:ArnT family glycosyltransferase n=1 Tax=unclassified Saccharopolyspora TaxID=2646250 RepID=UPI001CD7D0DE|nr:MULTISPECIES: glycosyltransferase family 39 protein [unclassified Saccharopolyspora]MCA1189384.1 glycosyltransferase family 39 protein [Saccharopolyspora sp. 6T]MCA1281014.1 glycosyltransferase family 39 protein [Saccharopolyspora sp. 7B]
MHTEVRATAARPPSTTAGPPAFARRPLLLVAAAFAVVHLVVGAFGGYWIDEVYMLAAGRYHPDWGYVDQPPLAPLLAGAMGWLAPGSMIVLRLPAVLISAGGVLLAGSLAREFGGDRRSQVLAGLGFATGLWTSLVAHWITPYTLEAPLWMLLCLLLVRWCRQHAEGRADDRLLLGLGGVIGVTMQVKVHVAVLCAALLLCLLVFGPRDLLRRPKFWGCIGIALVIAAPTLIWQAAHGWPQLAMSEVVQAETPILSGGRSGAALSMMLYMGVLGVPLCLYGVARMLTAAEFRPYRFIAAAALAQYAFYIATSGRPYYVVGMYGVLLAAGAVAFQRRREARAAAGRRGAAWLAWPAGALAVLAAGAVVVMSSMLATAFGVPADRALAGEVATAYRQLPAQQREHTAVVGESYILAAMLDAHTHEYGLPPAHSAHRGYGYFGTPDDGARDVLFVGEDPEPWRPHFAAVRRIDGGGTPLWLLTDRQEPWPQLWEQVRSLK